VPQPIGALGEWLPGNRGVPEVGLSRARIIRIVVDFPAPLGLVGGVHSDDLASEGLVANLSPGRLLLTVLVVGRWSDLQPMLGQHGADRLDASSQTTFELVALVLLDVPHDYLCGRSSSAAKKVDAALSHRVGPLQLGVSPASVASVPPTPRSWSRVVRRRRPRCGAPTCAPSPACRSPAAQPPSPSQPTPTHDRPGPHRPSAPPALAALAGTSALCSLV
jgi:hypothetical protein